MRPLEEASNSTSPRHPRPVYFLKACACVITDLKFSTRAHDGAQDLGVGFGWDIRRPRGQRRQRQADPPPPLHPREIRWRQLHGGVPAASFPAGRQRHIRDFGELGVLDHELRVPARTGSQGSCAGSRPSFIGTDLAGPTYLSTVTLVFTAGERRGSTLTMQPARQVPIRLRRDGGARRGGPNRGVQDRFLERLATPYFRWEA
jgi:hypothetical protein